MASMVESRDLPANRIHWSALICVGLVALAFTPLLVLHLLDLNTRPHYEFVPLLVPAAGALLWQRCRSLGDLEPGERKIATALAVGIWLILATAILFLSKSLGAIAVVATLLAAGYTIGGKRLAIAVMPACVMLLLAIPPPFQLDYKLVAQLQAIVSRCAGELLDGLKINHLMEGNVIELGNRSLLVDQACSGVYSLFTLGTATIFYLLWTRAAWWRWVVLLGASIFWVLAGNILRVVAITVLATRYNIDATVGRKHTALGLGGFLFMLLMVACTDRGLAFVGSLGRLARHYLLGTRRQVVRATWNDLLFRVNEWKDRRESGRVHRGEKWRRIIAKGEVTGDSQAIAASAPRLTGPTRWPDPARTWIGAPIAGAAFALLLLPQTRMPGLDWAGILSDRDIEAKAFARLGAESLPEDVLGMKRGSFNSVTRDHDLIWGENSRSWNYVRQDQAIVVSLDYPFVGWHELNDCYKGRGFQLRNREIVPNATGGGTVILDLARDDGQYGRVIYGLFDRSGKALRPPDQVDLKDMIQNRLRNWFGTGDQGGNSPTHQIQVVTWASAPLSERELQGLMDLYHETDRVVHKEPIDPASGKAVAR